MTDTYSGGVNYNAVADPLQGIVDTGIDAADPELGALTPLLDAGISAFGGSPSYSSGASDGGGGFAPSQMSYGPFNAFTKTLPGLTGTPGVIGYAPATNLQAPQLPQIPSSAAVAPQLPAIGGVQPTTAGYAGGGGASASPGGVASAQPIMLGGVPVAGQSPQAIGIAQPQSAPQVVSAEGGQPLQGYVSNQPQQQAPGGWPQQLQMLAGGASQMAQQAAQGIGQGLQAAGGAIVNTAGQLLSPITGTPAYAKGGGGQQAQGGGFAVPPPPTVPTLTPEQASQNLSQIVQGIGQGFAGARPDRNTLDKDIDNAKQQLLGALAETGIQMAKAIAAENKKWSTPIKGLRGTDWVTRQQTGDMSLNEYLNFQRVQANQAQERYNALAHGASPVTRGQFNQLVSAYMNENQGIAGFYRGGAAYMSQLPGGKALGGGQAMMANNIDTPENAVAQAAQDVQAIRGRQMREAREIEDHANKQVAALLAERAPLDKEKQDLAKTLMDLRQQSMKEMFDTIQAKQTAANGANSAAIQAAGVTIAEAHAREQSDQLKLQGDRYKHELDMKDKEEGRKNREEEFKEKQAVAAANLAAVNLNAGQAAKMANEARLLMKDNKDLTYDQAAKMVMPFFFPSTLTAPAPQAPTVAGKESVTK